MIITYNTQKKTKEKFHNCYLDSLQQVIATVNDIMRGTVVGYREMLIIRSLRLNCPPPRKYQTNFSIIKSVVKRIQLFKNTFNASLAKSQCPRMNGDNIIDA